MSTSLLIEIALLVLTLILAGYGGIYAYKRAKKQEAEDFKMLARKGYVVTYTRQEDAGPVTLIWGKCSQPTSFYIKVCNRNALELMAAQSGIKNIKVGFPDFDNRFVVRGNDENLLKKFLTKAIMNRFLKFKQITFLTGSFDSTLIGDAWSQQKANRKIRHFWLMRISGKIEGEEIERYLSFSQQLAESIETINKDLPQFESGTRSLFETGRFEGR